MSDAPKQDQLLVALLNRASTTHRLSILDRLSSSFEIVSERSLRLSLPQDDGLLRSLLAHEIESEGEAETLVKWAVTFTAATNFFFVLQLSPTEPNNDLFELFHNDHAPKLREAYGEDEIYASPSRATAEMQIKLLFPELISPTDALAQQLESTSLEAPPMTHATTSSSQASGSGFSQHSSTSTAPSSAPSLRPQSRASNHPASSQASTFKARPIPSTVSNKPSIQPRLSKAAALRMGVEIPSPAPTRTATSPVKSAAGDVGISGVAKRPVALPASLRAPTIAPRLNKAAVARQGGAVDSPLGGRVSRPSSAAGRSSANTHKPFPSPSPAAEVGGRQRKEFDFSNTPGHKRLSLTAVGRTSIASIAPPAIAPRQNRASMSRITGSTPSQPSVTSVSKGPPSAYKPIVSGRDRSSSLSTPGSEVRERKPISFDQTPGHKRASLSLSIPSLAAPSLAPRQNRASLARTRPSLPTPAVVSPRSSTKPLPSPQTRVESKKEGEKENRRTDFATIPGHKRQSLSFSLTSLKQPSIMPRLNKAAGARIGAGGVGGATREG